MPPEKKTTHQALAVALPKKSAVISDITTDHLSHPSAKTLQPASQRKKVTAGTVHTTAQKSTTLRREHLKKPLARRVGNAKRVHRAVERSQRISRFAPVSAIPKASSAAGPDEDLTRQAKVLRDKHAHHLQAKAAPKPQISSRAVKEHLLKKHLEAAPNLPLKEVYQAGKLSPKARWMSVATTSLALVLLGGYLTYINIPNLSIKVAAANAGINASLPQYQPGGYRLQGPISYSPGEVEVKYQQNGGSEGYQITQKTTDWDPQAALDNYVKPDSSDNYQIRSIQGLTVYAYAQKAVWVNGGILHILNGSAPLSGQQVERIAASM